MKQGDEIDQQALLGLLEKEKENIADFDSYAITGTYSKIGKFFHVVRRYGPRGLWGLSKILPFSFRHTAKTFCGRPIEILLPENLMTVLFGTLYGGMDLKLAEFLIKNLKADDVFYDIGSHIGFFSVVATELIKTGEVHAFEPNPKIFPIMKDNLSGRKNCFANQIALSDTEGVIDFYADMKMGSGVSSIGIQRGTLQKIKVKTTMLDAYCVSHKKPTFIKIDAEGAEKCIIDGGSGVFKESDPTIVMEFARDESHQAAAKALYNMGYKSYKIDDMGELEAFDLMSRGSFDNFVFKR